MIPVGIMVDSLLAGIEFTLLYPVIASLEEAWQSVTLRCIASRGSLNRREADFHGC